MIKENLREPRHRFAKFWDNEKALLCFKIMADSRIQCNAEGCKAKGITLTYDHVKEEHNINFLQSYHLEQLELNKTSLA
jgi:hypothetical protein